METLLYYFSYPFVRYAIIVGMLIALCASLFGATLVLKGFSFVGSSLSHVAFGTIIVATVLQVNNKMMLVLPITIITAVVLLRGGKYGKSRSDVTVAMLSVTSLALGYLAMNLFSNSANITADVCSTLFGSTSILTLTKGDVALAVILSLGVIGIFIVLYHKIFAITFDKDFAVASGINAELYQLFISVIMAVIIVLSMNLVGSLLITALIIFPAVTAMNIFNSFKKVVISSAIIGSLCAVVGIIISILMSTPVGPSIVLINVAVYGISKVYQLMRCIL